MKTTSALIAATMVIGVFSATSAAYAVDEYNVPKGTTVAGHGVALRANDVVALVSGLGVVPGQARFTYVHDGVAYYFASEETMKQFAAAPANYMPQYGGYCAYGVAKGKKLDGSPRFADIIDGKLYLFLNAGVFRAYEKRLATSITRPARPADGIVTSMRGGRPVKSRGASGNASSTSTSRRAASPTRAKMRALAASAPDCVRNQPSASMSRAVGRAVSTAASSPPPVVRRAACCTSAARSSVAGIIHPRFADLRCQ